MFKEIAFLLYFQCFASIIHSRTFNRLHKVPANDDMLLFWKTSGANRCKPFIPSYMNCNRCVCGADSILYCTRIICTGDEIEYEYEPESSDSHKDKKHKKRKMGFRKRRKHIKDFHQLYHDNYN